MASNAYKNYIVRYWYHSEKINHCFGNSLKLNVKARTEEEAIRKVKRKCFFSNLFKLHSIENTPIL